MNNKKQSHPSSRRADSRQRNHEPIWLYGRHAVAAAMANKARHIHKIMATLNANKWLLDHGLLQPGGWQPEAKKPEDIDRLLPKGAIHQGLAAQVNPLPDLTLEQACQNTDQDWRPVIILDQITDPQNIGAIFRSAAAFNARALIVQDRRTPPLSGALAKAAAGAIELVPCIRVVNIARALTALQQFGYHTVGLAGGADTLLSQISMDKPIALVMGAEGSGLRQLVSETCDQLVKIPIAAQMESLNVSNAAAISLYELSRPYSK